MDDNIPAHFVGKQRGMFGWDPNLTTLGEVEAQVTRSQAQQGHGSAPQSDNLAKDVVFNILPWWQYEIPSAQDFYLETMSTVVGAGATIAVPNFTLQVGQGQVGVVRSLQLTVQNPTATMRVAVGLLINSGAVQGWSNLNLNQIGGGAAALIQPYNDMVIRLGQNSIFSARLVNTDAVAWTVSVQATGWVCPLNDVQRLQGTIQY